MDRVLERVLVGLEKGRGVGRGGERGERTVCRGKRLWDESLALWAED
jgi:hypothetical protein